jgi:hypothetical protein
MAETSPLSNGFLEISLAPELPDDAFYSSRLALNLLSANGPYCRKRD